ncbi:hypothetical protein KCL53_001727 [Clostridium perfringens]|jgi:hypothetical protein|uniref:Lipoprotein n=1 Tax=Clostridium perfringens B str. ATCC 3626 TaxID=451754 RepID=A0AAV3BQR8_CLOPF|nr:hypothetical protein [Clostridium perfringens]EDT23179.1 conserved hypothetical protein [Clostridium perfringens B str. ATCC 3626]EHK2348607.1 hypothetical protein [Clostridium perfringens]EJT6665707.1 hypothetical protein [Clostridium perfringens]MDU4605085.1 hypothetical protein [Clostridium perfringens]
MKKKILSIILIGVLAIGSFSFIMYKKHKAENTPNIKASKIENKQEETKKSEKKEEVKQNDYYGLPEGFVTSIKNKDQLKEGQDFYQVNFINKESNYDVEEVLKAKRVVENFIQALLSFNRENPTEYSNIAMQYMDEPLKENFKHELEDIKKTAGLNPYNLSKPTYVYSSEQLNTLKNDYLEFKTRVKLENYDKRNQLIGRNMTPDYRVKLLPINGEWKIIEYQMD